MLSQSHSDWLLPARSQLQSPGARLAAETVDDVAAGQVAVAIGDREARATGSCGCRPSPRGKVARFETSACGKPVADDRLLERVGREDGVEPVGGVRRPDAPRVPGSRRGPTRSAAPWAGSRRRRRAPAGTPVVPRGMLRERAHRVGLLEAGVEAVHPIGRGLAAVGERQVCRRGPGHAQREPLGVHADPAAEAPFRTGTPPRRRRPGTRRRGRRPSSASAARSGRARRRAWDRRPTRPVRRRGHAWRCARARRRVRARRRSGRSATGPRGGRRRDRPSSGVRRRRRRSIDVRRSGDSSVYDAAA